jgi:hypothetical protein
MTVAAALFMEHAAAGGLDPATTAWVNQVVTNGGTVSTGRRTIVDTLITGLKTDGLWTKLDRLWLFAAENSQSALTDLVALASATPVNSPTFTVDRGYAGNGTSSYLNSNYNPSTAILYKQNDAHYSVYTRQSTAGTNIWLGAYDGTWITQLLQQNGTQFYMGINTNAGDSFNASGAGMNVVTRRSASAVEMFHNGISIFTNGTSPAVAVGNLNISICARNNAGTVDSFDTDQIAASSWGNQLSVTDMGNLSSRINTYMTSVGANVY